MFFENTFKQKTVGHFDSLGITWIILTYIMCTWIELDKNVRLILSPGNNLNHSPIHYDFKITFRQKLVSSFCRFSNNLNHSPIQYMYQNTFRKKLPAHFSALGITWIIFTCIMFTRIRFDKKWSTHFVALEITWIFLSCIICTRIRLGKTGRFILSIYV